MIDEQPTMINPISEILLRWEQARSGGETLGAVELCQDCPELLEEVQARIAVLEVMYAIPNQDPEGCGTSQPTLTDRAPVLEPALHAKGYELLSELGCGGMGMVWKARHLSLNRLVALKMILGGRRARRQDVMRFQIE